MKIIIIIIICFISGIMLISNAFNLLSFWKGINKEEIKEYFNEMSDKDLVGKIGYVEYRKIFEEVSTLKIDVNNVISSIDYSNIKEILKKEKGKTSLLEEKKKDNTENYKKNDKNIKRKRFPKFLKKNN